jgi:hypothetical protein
VQIVPEAALKEGLSFVDFAPVADTNNEDAQSTILNVGDDVVVADPVFPECPEF